MKHYNSRTEANRANAQHSTGPKTDEGKRIASHNAVKTGLTGRTVLLPTDDLAEYESLKQQLQTRHQPATPEEHDLLEAILHAEWRLRRIPYLETSIQALGRLEFADSHPDQPADLRRALIEAQMHVTYSKQLANLALQESRLYRQRAKLVAELNTLVDARKKAAGSIVEQAATLYRKLQEQDKPFPYSRLRELGFEFSLDDLKRNLVNFEVRQSFCHWPALDTPERLLAKELNVI